MLMLQQVVVPLGCCQALLLAARLIKSNTATSLCPRLLLFHQVGGEVARRARGLGMKVVAYDPYASAEKAAAVGVTLVSFDEALAQGDFFSLHMPLTPGTKNMFNDAAFAKMKKGARIMNVARGGVIEDEALARALDAGIVAAAALDVFEEEPPKFEGHPLIGRCAPSRTVAPPGWQADAFELRRGGLAWCCSSRCIARAKCFVYNAPYRAVASGHDACIILGEPVAAFAVVFTAQDPTLCCCCCCWLCMVLLVQAQCRVHPPLGCQHH